VKRGATQQAGNGSIRHCDSIQLNKDERTLTDVEINLGAAHPEVPRITPAARLRHSRPDPDPPGLVAPSIGRPGAE